MDFISRKKNWIILSLFMSVIFMVSFGIRETMGEDFERDYKPSVLTLIKAKSRNSVITAGGRFSVKSASEIFDVQGNPLSIRELPVPCMAKLRSDPSRYGGEPTVLRIQIQEVLQGATTGWKAQSPE